MIECSYREKGLGKKLSNLSPYRFTLDGVACGSMEGFLQSLKFSDTVVQRRVAELDGYTAWRTGQGGNSWKSEQRLYWLDTTLRRESAEYFSLIARAYDACVAENTDFALALYESSPQVLTHEGKTNQKDTVLTVAEYLYQLYRLRSEIMVQFDEEAHG